MSEQSERAAREIEALLKKEDLYIDGGDLRDILAEEFEKGGDATWSSTPVQDGLMPTVESEPISNAAPTVQAPSAADMPAEEVEKMRERLKGIEETEPRVPYQAPSAAERLLDRQDADHAKYIDWATRELKAQIADRHRLQNELIEAQSQLAAERKRTLDWARKRGKDCPVCGAP